MEITRLKGVNGTLVVCDDRIIIERKGLMSMATQGLRGDKTFFYSDLTAVDYKAPGFTGGYFHFRTSGSNTMAPGVSLNALLSPSDPEWKAALSNENAIMLNGWGGSTESDYAYEKINEYWNKCKEDSRGGNTFVNAASEADELRKFKQLLDDGIISQSEFDAKKKQILGL